MYFKEWHGWRRGRARVLLVSESLIPTRVRRAAPFWYSIGRGFDSSLFAFSFGFPLLPPHSWAGKEVRAVDLNHRSVNIDNNARYTEQEKRRLLPSGISVVFADDSKPWGGGDGGVFCTSSLR